MLAPAALSSPKRNAMPIDHTIYLDCHATTPIDPTVLDRMLPYFTSEFGNAASRSHRFGWAAETALENARVQVSTLIGARPTEIVFTSGATEAINLALLGLAQSPGARRNHIITQKTEHAAVLECIDALEGRGFRVTRLDVDAVGRIDLEQLQRALDERALLVAIMLANNEIGTVQPIDEIGRACREVGARFFCDLTQGLGWHPIDVDRSSIDLASMSSHKIYGPKGAGALFVRRFRPKVHLDSILYGGEQERGIRPGTPNVPGIVGLGAACELMSANGSDVRGQTSRLRDRLQKTIFDSIAGVQLNGCPKNRHPGNLNIAVPGVSGERLMGALPDIAFSAGSACTSASAKPSHVITALGADASRLKGSVRFGVSKTNTEAEIDAVAKRFVAAVEKLR